MTDTDRTIPPGYKMTEVGVIPDDWKVKALESITPPNKKYGIVDGLFGSNLKTNHYKNSGTPSSAVYISCTALLPADEGSSTVKVVPCPIILSTVIRPW